MQIKNADRLIGIKKELDNYFLVVYFPKTKYVIENGTIAQIGIKMMRVRSSNYIIHQR